jgi:type VI secretion system protein VasD
VRLIPRSFGPAVVLAFCAAAHAQSPAPTAPAPAPAAAPAPGISLQIPGMPFSPTLSVPIPGLQQAPPSVSPQAQGPVAAPVQAPSAVSVPIPGVPGAPTLSVPVPGLQQAPAQAVVPGKPQIAPQAQSQQAAPQPPAPPKPSVAELSFVIDANVNPDASGRPSPVVVRIYELRSVAAFNKADFFSLYERDKEQLGPELVSRDELPLMPGGKPQAITTLRTDTRYLGVVAAFRDIERARWRASTPIFVNQTTRMEIKLDRNEIAIKLQ